MRCKFHPDFFFDSGVNYKMGYIVRANNMTLDGRVDLGVKDTDIKIDFEGDFGAIKVAEFTSEATSSFNRFKQRFRLYSMKKIFKEDIKTLEESITEIFKARTGQHNYSISTIYITSF